MKIIISLVWLVSLALAFTMGKSSVVPSTEVKIEVLEKIVEKESAQLLVKNTPSEALVDLKSEKTGSKTKSKPDRKYHQKRYDFLTKRSVQEEARIDCRGGNEVACWHLETLFRITGQKKKLLKHLNSNCTNDKVDSCVQLHNLEENKALKKKITSKLKEECKRNNAKACVSLGSILEYRDIKLDKVAFELRERGCELDVKTCDSLGASLNRIKDPRAGQFFLKACEAGGKYSCQSASHYYFKKGLIDKGGEMLRMACDQKQSHVCWSYYEFLLANKRLDEAKSFLKGSCENDKIKNLFGCK